MKDIAHTVQVDSHDKGTCESCGVEIPVDVALAAMEFSDGVVIQIAGSFAPAEVYASQAMVKCTHPSAASELRSAQKLEDVGLELAGTPEGENLVRFGKKPEAEKRANRGSFHNFMMMKEMTRLDADGNE